MTINNDLKSKYFAMYLGQKVYCKTKESQRKFELTPIYLSSEYVWMGILELRSIESLTSIELQKTSEIVGQSQIGEQQTKILLDKYMDSRHCNLTAWEWYQVFEYLKSISIALPLFDQSTNTLISVDELIKEGIVKITR